MPPKTVNWSHQAEAALLIRVIDQAGSFKIDAEKIISTWPVDVLGGPPTARTIQDRVRLIRQRDMNQNGGTSSTKDGGSSKSKQSTGSSKKRKLDTDGANSNDEDDDNVKKEEGDTEEEEKPDVGPAKSRRTRLYRKLNSASNGKHGRARIGRPNIDDTEDEEARMSRSEGDSDATETAGLVDPFNSKKPSRRSTSRHSSSKTPMYINDGSSSEGVTGGTDGANDSDGSFDYTKNKRAERGEEDVEERPLFSKKGSAKKKNAYKWQKESWA